VCTCPARVDSYHVGERESPSVELRQDNVVSAIDKRVGQSEEEIDIDRGDRNLQVFELGEDGTASDACFIRMSRFAKSDALQHVMTTDSTLNGSLKTKSQAS
jgi:hypothetical protein